MDIKLSFVFVVLISVVEYSHSASWFDSLFESDSPDSEESNVENVTPTTTATANGHDVKTAGNSMSGKSTSSLAKDPPTPIKPPETNRSQNAQPEPDMVLKMPRLGNMGAPVLLNTFGLFTSLLSRSVGGLRKMVNDSTDLTVSAINGANKINNATLDAVQDVIQTGATRTLDRIASLTKTLDMYKNALSGATGQNVDKSHSITITTSSDAPMQTMSNFMKKYMPAGAADTNLPPVTSVDLTNFF